MKINLFAIFCLAALLIAANATVFEAETSEDVDLFLKDFENETIALMFYDSKNENQDDEDWFSRLSSKILGIFMSKDQFGRSTEDWVEMFDDKLHLMRIDVQNKDNLRSREEFNIEFAPYIVLQDKRRTVLREKIDAETYEHVRMLLDRRPNILHKTGGAALKSFNLEPDSDAPDTAPRVIQYFDLEEGSPTNVEQPIQTQYVNWAPVEVIGPDGDWEDRGRNWVTSFEIPDSGIKNQKNPKKVHIQQRIRDDPRPKVVPKPVAKPVQKPVAKPVQKPVAKPAPQKPVASPAPKQTVRSAPKPTQGTKPTTTQVQGRRPTGTVQGKIQGSTTPKTTTTSTVKQAAPTQSSSRMPQRHPYHSRQYGGYGEYGSPQRSYY